MKHKYKLQNLVSKLLLLTILVSSMSLSAVSNVRAEEDIDLGITKFKETKVVEGTGAQINVSMSVGAQSKSSELLNTADLYKLSYGCGPSIIKTFATLAATGQTTYIGEKKGTATIHMYGTNESSNDTKTATCLDGEGIKNSASALITIDDEIKSNYKYIFFVGSSAAMNYTYEVGSQYNVRYGQPKCFEWSAYYHLYEPGTPPPPSITSNLTTLNLFNFCF